MKKCAKCGVEKPLSDFSKDSQAPDKLCYCCRDCRRERYASWSKNNPRTCETEKQKHARRQAMKRYRIRHPEKARKNKFAQRLRGYGLSVADFQIRLDAQDNKCAICRVNFIATPHIDHCHKTGVVRGLLCPKCNPALGAFQDSPDILKAAIRYLSASSGTSDFCGDAGC